jgi:hypothetical protein
MAYSDSPREEGRPGWNGGRDANRRSCSRAGAWRPLEIVAVVAGFMIYWPIGLAILGFKFWQRSTGYEGSMVTAVRQGWSYAENRGAAFGQSWGRNWRGESTGFRGFSGGQTGNSAFDDWRSAELARLEEEHRKLEAAEREFADFLRNLRQAKDREEFDRFMQARRGGSAN